MPDETKRGPGRPRNVILGEAETVASEVVAEATQAAEGKETIGEALQHVASDVTDAVKTAVEGTTTVEKVAAAIEAAEHVGLEFVSEFIHEHAAPLAPLWDEIEPEVETRVFVATNLVTSDFAHLGETYIVELEAKVVKGLHDTALKAVIEAKILKDKGVRLLSNALHYLEVTTAKFLPHHAE